MQYANGFRVSLTPAFVLLLSFGSLTALTTGCGPGDEDDDPVVIGDHEDTGADDSAPGTAPGDTDRATDRDSAPHAARDTGPAPAPGSDTSRDSADESDDTRPTRPDGGFEPPSDTGDTGKKTDDCKGTRRMCDGVCTELLSNPNACGSCDNQCGSAASCVNGICTCPDDFKKCGGKCVDPTSNDNHCFKCGNACPSGQMCQNSVCVEANPKKAVLKYTNQARKTPTDCGQYGVKPAGPPLTRNSELDKAAQAHAESMAKHNFFAHKDPTDGSDYTVRVSRTNYSGDAIHENIARGLRQSARAIVDGWISSDNHCRGLANPRAEEIGIGYVKLENPNDGRWESYWVQVFGIQ